MIVAFDNTFLSLIFNPKTDIPLDPTTNEKVTHCLLRIEGLIDEYSHRGDSIIIPTPCLSEMLVFVPDFVAAIEEINKSTVMEVKPFCARCAIDLAETIRRAKARGDKKSGSLAGWQEIKFDRQIATIAKTNEAEIFYTDDATQSHFAKMIGMQVKHSWELDLPTSKAQMDWERDL